MATVEVETGRYVKRFEFWNPSTWAVPALYWDTFSQEQRIHAICRQLSKVIAYADYVGVNVDDIAARLKAIEDGQLDEFIVAAIEEWFEENQPEIEAALTALNEALPIGSFDAENTVEDAIDATNAVIGEGFTPENTVKSSIDAIGDALPVSEFSAENTVKDAIDAMGADVEWLQRRRYSQPNFRCVDRFIWDDWGTDSVNSAQAGCVFVQNGTYYWAQILNSTVSGNDHFIIRDLYGNNTLADVKGQFGHGFTMSYNPTTKQIMTQDNEVSPYNIVLVNVENPSNPFIERTIALSQINVTNPCWYDATHFIAHDGNNVWSVYDLDQNYTGTSITFDLQGYSHDNGYTFQNICWYPETQEAYFGVTQPDGIAFIDVDEANETATMKDFIACQQYYGCLYMREMEFAIRVGDKMFINQFDEIDGLMVVSLLEWDMVHGTVPDENSKYIQTTGNVTFYIDWANGLLIPDASSANNSYKLAGDAINELNSIAGYSRGFLTFLSDYPNIVSGKSAKLQITTQANTPVTVHGFNFNSCDVIWSPAANGFIDVEPSIPTTAGGTAYNIGLKLYQTRINFPLVRTITLVNTTGISNPLRIYSEYSTIEALFANSLPFTSSDYLRWTIINSSNSSTVANATTQNCIVNSVS